MKHTPVDTLVIGGRVYTGVARRTRANAVLLRDGRVLAVGSERSLRAAKSRGTKILHVPDSAITPGLWDAHTHFFYWALNRELIIDVTGLDTLKKTLARISRERARKRLGEWVVARGFDQNLWQGGFPNARDLDSAVPHHPAMVHSRDGHSVWLNSAALRLLDITALTHDPPGGCYLRDEHGAPTGVLQEKAIALLPDPVSEFAARTDVAALRVIDRALASAYRIARRHGIIGVHSVDDAPSLTHLQRHHHEDVLGLRVVHAIPLDRLDDACRLGLRSGLGDDWLRLGAVKVFADGALGSQTAHMFDEYPRRPGYRGVASIPADELREIAIHAVRHGWALWVHAIGDQAVHDVIAAIAATRRIGRAPLPHRIEHAQCVRAADIRRMARSAIVASVQPAHVLGDIATADRHWPRARRHAYPLRALLDAGVTLAMGSDVPIESIDPRRGLHGAVTRTDAAHNPAGGWFPQQRISVAEALHAFTRGAAASVGMPTPYGTISPGAPADLTIWRDNPHTASVEDLLSLRIAGVVIGGIADTDTDA